MFILNCRDLRRLVLCGALCLATALCSAAVAQEEAKPEPAWRFTLNEGESVPSTVTLVNRCRRPHRFHIEREQTDFVLIDFPAGGEIVAPGGQRQVAIRFDASGKEPGLYPGSLVVVCADCRRERGCAQDRDVFFAEMTVVEPAAATNPDQLPGVREPTESGATAPHFAEEGELMIETLEDGFVASYERLDRRIVTRLRRQESGGTLSIEEASRGELVRIDIPEPAPVFSVVEHAASAGSLSIGSALLDSPANEQVLLLSLIAESSFLLSERLGSRETEPVMLAISSVPQLVGGQLERGGVDRDGPPLIIMIGPNDGRCHGACGPGCSWCYCRTRWCLCHVNLFCLVHDSCCGAWKDFFNCFPCEWHSWTF